jgi:hypothetical protein
VLVPVSMYARLMWANQIDASFKPERTVDPRQLSSFRNLTRRAQNLQPELILRLRSQFHILVLPEAPDVPTGLQCINPKPMKVEGEFASRDKTAGAPIARVLKTLTRIDCAQVDDHGQVRFATMPSRSPTQVSSKNRSTVSLDVLSV